MTHLPTPPRKMTLIGSILAFLLVQKKTDAWVSPVASVLPKITPGQSLQPPTDREHLGQLLATRDDNYGPHADAEKSLDRRTFFQSAISQAASLSLSLAASSSAAGMANAATTKFPSVYEPPLHSMDDKLVVITGGNTGLGLESAKRLTEAGATVVLTSRDATKGQKALDEVKQYLKDQKNEDAGKVMMVSLDLCDLEDVKNFRNRLENVIGKDRKINVLMNNAGVMAIPDRRLTKDGFEKTFQTNHLGHFALTSTLLPLLSSDARIINVSSSAHQIAGLKGLELDNLNGESQYGPWSSYGQSKLANILFTNELQKRAQESPSWSSLLVFSLHPGAVQTDLARFLIGEEKFQSMKENGFSSWTDKVLMEGLAKFVKTVQEGASTQVFLAADQGIGTKDGGKYFVDGTATRLEPYALDDKKAAELWKISEELTGVKFDL